MADLKDDEMLLAVKVPSNGTPGMVLNVSSPDGRVFEVVVPPNTPPGSTINVLVKKPPPTPEEAGLPVAVSVPAASGGMEAAAPTVKESGDAGDAHGQQHRAVGAPLGYFEADAAPTPSAQGVDFAPERDPSKAGVHP